MARLIDLDEVKNKLSEELKNIELPLLKRTLFKLLLEFVDDETVFKTVDAVEVVRCKNCRYFKKYTDILTGRKACYCKYKDGHFTGSELHYCSYGERREENETD